jgi:tetratricopeptide (TPR) repeat protein
MTMIWRGLLALVCAMTAASSARAEWLEARSRHFVLYADSGEQSIRRQSEALERLDWGLRRFMNLKDEPEIESRKLTVFLVEDRDIARLCRCSNIGGFYMSRVSGSLAFSGKGGWAEAGNNGRLVLFHEYAHHLLLGSYDLAFPGWYSEGFAEFASTMRINPDAAVIGYPAQHRAYGLLDGQRFSAEQMFDPALRSQLKSGEQVDAFYGRGWLMTHYVSFNPTRAGQFSDYMRAINKGTPGVAAARQAFGDLKAMNGELGAYLTRRSLPGMTMRYVDAQLPPVTIRKLSPGEAALIDLRMESVRGVSSESGAKLYAKAAPIAARYPDDAVAQGWFAEMAYDAEQDAVADGAATRALARDPKSVQALLYRGRVKLRQLEQAKSADPAAWDAARQFIIGANRSDPDDAEPLWWFWQSYAMEGREHRASAIKGLIRAQELAPQDEGVRFAAAMARLQAEELVEAKRLPRPLAYDPHAGADNPATRMIAALDAGKTGKEVIAAGAKAATAAVAQEAGEGK